MTIIDAINKAKHGDVIYNQGDEPNYDNSIKVEVGITNTLLFNRLSNFHDILKSIPAVLLLKDNWVIKRKMEKQKVEFEVFELEVDEMNLSTDKLRGKITISSDKFHQLVSIKKPKMKLVLESNEEEEIIK